MIPWKSPFAPCLNATHSIVIRNLLFRIKLCHWLQILLLPKREYEIKTQHTMEVLNEIRRKMVLYKQKKKKSLFCYIFNHPCFGTLDIPFRYALSSSYKQKWTEVSVFHMGRTKILDLRTLHMHNLKHGKYYKKVHQFPILLLSLYDNYNAYCESVIKQNKMLGCCFFKACWTVFMISLYRRHSSFFKQSQ